MDGYTSDFLLAMVMQFFEKNCRIAGTQWWLHLVIKSLILSQEIQLIEILANFFCNFFSCHITCARVATRDFCYALATQQF